MKVNKKTEHRDFRLSIPAITIKPYSVPFEGYIKPYRKEIRNAILYSNYGDEGYGYLPFYDNE